MIGIVAGGSVGSVCVCVGVSVGRRGGVVAWLVVVIACGHSF